MKQKLLLCASLLLLILASCKTGDGNNNSATPDPILARIELSGVELNFEGDAAEKTLTLSSNVAWQIKGSNDWCTVTPDRGAATGSVTLTVTVKDNNTNKNRSIALVVSPTEQTSISTSKSIAVIQTKGGQVMPETPAEWDGVRRGDIFYEIFVRSFADSNGDGIGDLRGVTAKLDYLVSLGVTGIWLTPINPSPSYHGYDVDDYKAVNPQLGTLADFDDLVAKARAKGIKVVLDFVINHSSKTHPWFVKALADPGSKERGYYSFAKRATVKADCEAGKIAMVDNNKYVADWWRVVDSENCYYGMFSDWMPDFNYGRVPKLNAVYDEILGAAKFWMERGVAGLRLDAVKHIYQDEWGQENIKFLKRFYEDLKKDYADIYMIGEVLGSTEQSSMFLQAIPSVFHFDSWWKLEDALANSRGRYYAKDMAECLAKFGGNAARVGTKLSNHDEDRAMSKLDQSIPKAKIAFAAIMATPGQPYIYYGEETGAWGTKSGGDENVREPLIWGDSYTTTWRTGRKPATVLAQQADANSLLNFYRDFTKLRNTYAALAEGTMSYPDPATTPNELMVVTREKGSEKIMVIANFANASLDYQITTPVKSLIKTHNGAMVLKFADGGYIAQMEPYSIVIVEI